MTWQGRSRMIIIASLTATALLATVIILWWCMQSRKPWPAEASCRDYSGTYDPVSPGSISAFAKSAHGIAVATVLNPQVYSDIQRLDSAPPRIRLTQVLKGGDVLHEGDELSLCPGLGAVHLTSNNPTILVFIDGRDNAEWVPKQGPIGVVPEGEDQRFAPQWVDSGPTSVTVAELQKIIQE